MPLIDKLKTASTLPKLRTEPLWKGPESDDPNGGITFSLLSRWLCCRERFRLYAVLGLQPADTFSHKIYYGVMWHVCEEALARKAPTGQAWQRRSSGATDWWMGELREYAESLCQRYPLQQEQIDHWYCVCKTQFPLYVKYWAGHPDVTSRTPLLQERVFSVPYTLPSGRIVRLRGKWDSVDLIGNGKEAGIFLQENKTKGDIRENQLRQQLSWDLQTMLYLVALGEYRWRLKVDVLEFADDNSNPEVKLPSSYLGQLPADMLVDYSIKVSGVRYNVIRRPLSGGKGSIVRHKPTKSNPQGESKESYYSRLRGIIEAEPESYFMRWKVEITPEDILRFRRECLDPILEQLCDWYEWVVSGDPFRSDVGRLVKMGGLHWRYPFGVYNVLDEGGSSDLDEYLTTGSTVGLTVAESLFEELS